MSSMEEVKRYAVMASELSNGIITPGSVVGAGYKDARKIAFQYISRELLKNLQKLENETNV